MRILLVSEDIPQPTLGGLAQHVMKLARALIKDGHKVDLLGNNQHPIEISGEDGKFDGQFYGELYSHLKLWKEQQLGVFLPLRRPWIAKKIAKSILNHAANYDVIHYHGHYPNVGKYIPKNINFIQTRHDQGSDCVIHIRFRDGEICSKINPIDCATCINKNPNKLQVSSSKLAINNYRRDVSEAFNRHKTIFVSEMLINNFMRSTKLTRTGYVLHNFVDTQKINEYLFSSNEDSNNLNGLQVNIFFAGMVYEPKGIEPFLKLIAPIIPSNFNLLIAGSGPDENRLRLEYTTEQIKFLGWCDYPSVINYINHCDALIVPSIWEEPCGTTILEGLALNTPTFALNRGGTPELSQYEFYPQQLKLFSTMEELVLRLTQLTSTKKIKPQENFKNDVTHCIDHLIKIYNQ